MIIIIIVINALIEWKVQSCGLHSYSSRNKVDGWEHCFGESQDLNSKTQGSFGILWDFLFVVKTM